MHNAVTFSADIASTGAGAATGRWLAFDTSSERMSIAVCDGARLWQHEAAGAALSSTTLIPAIMQLLETADLRLNQLDAIAFGRGPGSFTGLRTACAVAQGLALGAGVPVLPVDTLSALAEEARFQWLKTYPQTALPQQLSAMLDARMNEIYVQHFHLNSTAYQPLAPCSLVPPQGLAGAWLSDASQLLTGNVFEVYADRLPAFPAGSTALPALPTAAAMLRLAPALMAAGAARPPEQALPLYVRDKVAQTTDERAQIQRAALATAT
jgi:tRNA threonylcarbamoyladenosine biosynthesis protein TsaB